MAFSHWNDLDDLSDTECRLFGVGSSSQQEYLELGSEESSSELKPQETALDQQLYCQPCLHQYSKHKEAYGYCQNCMEHLCCTCYTTHTNPKPCRNHVLMNSMLMPKTISTEISSIQACETHRDKKIEYECKTCDILGCSVCITLNHSICDKVYINDSAENLETDKDLSTLLRKLKSLCTEVQHIKSKASRNEETVQKRKQQISRQIKAFRQDINTQLDNWEAKLEEENQVLNDEEVAKAASVSVESEAILKRAKHLQERLFKTLEQAGGNSRILYIEVKKDEKVLNELEKGVKELQEIGDIKEYHFIQKQDTVEGLMSENALGMISSIIIPENGSGKLQCSSLSKSTIPKFKKQTKDKR